jgi:hypothetical protein
MVKLAKTTSELEGLVLAELRAVPECADARHVTVIAYDDFRASSNWQVASFNPGTADWSRCESAVSSIVGQLQARFEMLH